jgi:hypothetical protein
MFAAPLLVAVNVNVNVNDDDDDRAGSRGPRRPARRCRDRTGARGRRWA